METRRRYLSSIAASVAQTEDLAYVYAASSSGALYWSQDAGSSFSARSNSPSVSTYWGWVNLAVDVNNSVYINVSGSTVCYYADKTGSYTSNGIQTLYGATSAMCISSGSEYLCSAGRHSASWVDLKMGGSLVLENNVNGTPVTGSTVCSEDGKYFCTGISSYSSYGNGWVYVNRNYGAKNYWVQLTMSSSNDTMPYQIAMSNSGQYTLVASAKGLYVSTDYLNSFNQISTSTYTAVAVSGDGKVWYIGNSSGIQVSFDYGSSWLSTELPACKKIYTSYLGRTLVGMTTSGQLITSKNYKSYTYPISGTFTGLAINHYKKTT